MRKSILMIIGLVLISGCCGGYQSLPGVIDVPEDEVYGEIWNYSSTGYLFPITAPDVYYNLTGLVAGELEDFSYINSNQAGGGSQLVALKPGVYNAVFSMSFYSINVGGLFGMGIVQNHDIDMHRNCYSRRGATTEVGSISITCILDLDVGDIVNIQIDNENTDRDIYVHTANLKLIRVGVTV